jgi:3-dehydroquinate synthase
MMGAGKSVVGRLVAARLGWPWVDSDEEVQRRTGRTVAWLFGERGEAAFRAEEARVLADALARKGPLVISVAGGAVLRTDNRAVLREGAFVVWLRAELDTLAARVTGSDHRPLLAGDHAARLAALYAARGPHYEELADVVVDVDALGPGEVADQVVTAYRAAAQEAARAAAAAVGREHRA